MMSYVHLNRTKLVQAIYAGSTRSLSSVKLPPYHNLYHEDEEEDDEDEDDDEEEEDDEDDGCDEDGLKS